MTGVQTCALPILDVALPKEIEEALDVVTSAKEDKDPSEIKDYAEEKGMTVAQGKSVKMK